MIFIYNLRDFKNVSCISVTNINLRLLKKEKVFKKLLYCVCTYCICIHSNVQNWCENSPTNSSTMIQIDMLLFFVFKSWQVCLHQRPADAPTFILKKKRGGGYVGNCERECVGVWENGNRLVCKSFKNMLKTMYVFCL